MLSFQSPNHFRLEFAVTTSARLLLSLSTLVSFATLLACGSSPSSGFGSGGATNVIVQGGSTALGQGGGFVAAGGSTGVATGGSLILQGGATSIGQGGSNVGLGGTTSGNAGGTTAIASGGSVNLGGASSTARGGTTANQGGTQAVGGSSSGTASTTTGTWPKCNITDAQIQSEYTNWNSKYVSTCPSGGKRVVGCAASTCSEAMGYGMLIAVNSGHQDLFNSLWTLVDALIPVPSAGGTVAGNNLVPWSINSDCSVADYNNATDGDLDIAMSLVQADKRWPGNGYLDKAIPIIKDILNKNTALTGGKRVLLTGAKQTVGDGGRPSYFAPGYYRVFIDIFKRTAYADAAQVTGWTELLNSTYALTTAAQAGTPGSLWPDWWPLDGSKASGQAFGWDGCRAPWRIASDYAWFNSTDASTSLLAARAVQANPYTAAPQKNSALVGSLAFTAMPAGQAAFQTACDQWLAGPLSDGVYFQDSLKIIYMQLAGGFFPSTL